MLIYSCMIINFCRVPLSSLHRKLLGLGDFSITNEPVMPEKNTTIESRRVTPPRRSTIQATSVLTNGSDFPSQLPTPPGSQGLSPHRKISTPAQLQRVLDEFETDIAALQAIAPSAMTSQTSSHFPAATYVQGTPTGGTYR